MNLHELLEPLRFELFRLGDSPLTVGGLLGACVALVALLLVSRAVSAWVTDGMLKRHNVDLSTRSTVATLLRYTILVTGFFAVLDNVGLKLSSLSVLAGAFGVGVGFGLQNIFSNFISGLIVMFERPVKIGDHVVVGAVEGDVVSIGARATTLLTAQRTHVIVPNQSLITGPVTNWDVGGSNTMVLSVRMNGGQAEDEALLLAAAQANKAVLATPAPSVFITAADHAGRTLELHFVVAGDAATRHRVRSEVYRSIIDALGAKEANFAPNP
ncbi:mechanosensitive ion channel domain-containing protein [Niveibacterium sp. SC-1]|uniref:mechanosensitive ion channel family protein n=1 Tax=Niveibacterium sp. SC-1 TaxID=3135646 RepID=UPI00311FBC8B